MFLTILTSLLASMWLAIEITPARAAEAPIAVIVFDGSASMWGQPAAEANAPEKNGSGKSNAEKKTKLALAREALRTGFDKAGLEKSASALRLGLVSFGHRRSGDCSDVEVQVKPAPGTVARINGILDAYNPRGRGPITQALRLAAKELGIDGQPATIILIHDDPDNCQADPCAALPELQKANPKVVVHVVSLAMKREDAQRMTCLTRPTGGTLAEAADAQQVTAAIAAALQRASGGASAGVNGDVNGGATGMVAVAANASGQLPVVPVGKSGLQLQAKLSADGADIITPLRWRIRAAGQPNAPLVHESDAVVTAVELAPGRYDVEAQYGFVVAQRTEEVRAGEFRPVTIALGAGNVQVLDAAMQGKLFSDAVMTFTRTEPRPETISMLRGLVPEIALSPGRYLLGVTVGPQRIERAVTVKLGERISLDPPLAIGELDLDLAAAAAGPQVEGASTTVFEDDPDAPRGRREIARSSASRPVFALLAGTYYVVVRLGGAEVRERFVIHANERTERRLILDVARVSVVTRPAGRIDGSAAVVLKLQPADDAKQAQISRRSQAVFDVPAGRYRLEGRIGDGNAVVERDLDLKAGAREQIVLEVPAGSLRLRWVDSSGMSLPDVAWEIRDRSGRLVWSAIASDAAPLLLQGRYTVKAESRNRRLSRELEVRAGEVRAVDLTGP